MMPHAFCVGELCLSQQVPKVPPVLMRIFRSFSSSDHIDASVVGMHHWRLRSCFTFYGFQGVDN